MCRVSRWEIVNVKCDGYRQWSFAIFWNNGSRKFSGIRRNDHARKEQRWDGCICSRTLYRVGITYGVQIVRINEDNLALSGKSSIIIIPRMPQFPNASCKRQRFSGNAYVRDLFLSVETPRRCASKGRGEDAAKGNTRDKGERRVHTCSPFVTDSALSTSRKYAANVITRRRQATFDGLMRLRDIKVFIACKR